MAADFYFKISEFAKATGIKRENLIFYDHIGLLSPEFRAENGYRYYTRSQLGTAYLIGSLREIGIGIERIKQYAEKRSPQAMLLLFQEQEKRIEDEIQKLNQIRDIMKLSSEIAEEAMNDDESKIYVREKKAEGIFLGQPVPTDEPEDKSLMKFYQEAGLKGVSLNYPLGVRMSKSQLIENRLNYVENYYFRMPRTEISLKPAGKYVVGYGRGDYGKSIVVYNRLLQYIKENNLNICGYSYEEYPLNEISLPNADDYLIRVEINVDTDFI